MVFITFIIPTIGRVSLYDSIKSLINQTDIDWNAIVIFDGIKKNIEISDDRIFFLEIEKMGNNKTKSMSGEVRNIGLQYAKNIDSEWIGFLDDDDFLGIDYIEKLKLEIKHNPLMEVCIFRMCYPNNYILPNSYDKTIIRGHVGISFAIKKYISQKIIFKNNPFEDFFFLEELRQNLYKIIISSFVTYYIKFNNLLVSNHTIFPKIKINF